MHGGVPPGREAGGGGGGGGGRGGGAWEEEGAMGSVAGIRPLNQRHNEYERESTNVITPLLPSAW